MSYFILYKALIYTYKYTYIHMHTYIIYTRTYTYREGGRKSEEGRGNCPETGYLFRRFFLTNLMTILI